MKKCILTFIAVVGLLMADGQTSLTELRHRIFATYMIVWGREASYSEYSELAQFKDFTIAQMVDKIMRQIDVAAETQIVFKSYIDAEGRWPSKEESKLLYKHTENNYAILMKINMQRLAQTPADYENTIKRSYKWSLNRLPTNDELAWWKQQGVYSFIAMVACLDDWHKRGEQGETNIITKSINPRNTQIITLCDKVASEVKSYLNLTVTGNMYSIGAEKVKSTFGNEMLSSSQSIHLPQTPF